MHVQCCPTDCASNEMHEWGAPLRGGILGVLSDIGDTHFEKRGCFVHPGLGPPIVGASILCEWLCLMAMHCSAVFPRCAYTSLPQWPAVVFSMPEYVNIGGKCSPVACASLVQLCAQWFSDAFSGPAERTSPGTFTHVLSELCSRNGVWCGIFSPRRHASADVQLRKPAKFVCTCAKVLC